MRHGLGYLVGVVGDVHQPRPLFHRGDAVQDVGNSVAAGGVQALRRFVHHKQPGPQRNGSPNEDHLLLALRQAAERTLQERQFHGVAAAQWRY